MFEISNTNTGEKFGSYSDYQEAKKAFDDLARSANFSVFFTHIIDTCAAPETAPAEPEGCWVDKDLPKIDFCPEMYGDCRSAVERAADSNEQGEPI